MSPHDFAGMIEFRNRPPAFDHEDLWVAAGLFHE
jgi:hypothetical protein